MHLHQRVLGAWAILAALTFPAQADDAAHRQALAMSFARNSRGMVATEPMTVEGTDLAIVLLQEAVQLDPDNVEHWRALLDVATLAERDALKEEALRQLGRLDPADDVVRLMRVYLAADRFQTADERIAAYQKLLSEENRRRLGAPVASRLALELAILHRRIGDSQAYAHWLAESVILDPAHRVAVAEATGYYGSNVEDAYGLAELLKAQLLADPTDGETQVMLAQLLLEHGAYAGADRLYQMADRTFRASGQPPASNLLADTAIAQWGRGDTRAALQTIHFRQHEADLQLRLAVRTDFSTLPRLADTNPIIRETILSWWGPSVLNPDGSVNHDEVVTRLDLDHGLTTAEDSQLHGTISPTLATVRAAIHAATEDDRAPASLRRAIVAYETAIMAAEAQFEPDSSELAGIHLELASVLLWLGGDVEKAGEHLRLAKEIQPLSEAAGDRFAALIADRGGEEEKAAELFARHGESDPASALGLAELLLRQGRRREAGRRYLQIARATPGTLIGVWSVHRLRQLLQHQVPATETASGLEELIDSIPRVVDRFARDGSLAVLLQISPAKVRYQPYEPIIINVQVTNTAPFPISIDLNGPLRPDVVLVPSVQVAGLSVSDPVSRLSQRRAIVADIGRRLRLEPRERLTIPIDLRQYLLGGLFEQFPLEGVLLSIRALTNVIVTAMPVNPEQAPGQSLMPIFFAGVMGTDIEMPLTRVEGVNVTAEWLEESLAAIAEPDIPEDVRLMALLSRWLERAWTFRIASVLEPIPELDEPFATKYARAERLVGQALDIRRPHADRLGENREALAILEEMAADIPPGRNRTTLWQRIEQVRQAIFRLEMEPTVASALAEAFPKLDGLEQAWLLSVMPHAASTLPAGVPSTGSIQAMACQSEDRLVQLAYLLYHVEGLEDPMVTAGQRSEDEGVRQVADLLFRMFQRARAAQEAARNR
ncbi:MAG: hypothetical protein JSV91_13345 [Phycisphaerales bacterium]|nr:MAG: hypothetical protein JSV91_13345 [Phycisphaerales bacterium]